MKPSIKYILLFLLAFNVSFAQTVGIYDEYLKLPEHLKKAEGSINIFEVKTEEGIISLQLKSDSTFIYYSIFAHSFYETIGKYDIQNNIVCLNWDSAGSYKLHADTTSIYKKYFVSRQPTPLEIINVKYKLHSEVRKLIKQPLIQYRGIELFFSSKDVFNKPFRIDSIWREDFITTTNKLTIITKSKKQIVFSRDSIWGYRVFFAQSGVFDRLFRLDGSPEGIHVVQIDGIVIYENCNTNTGKSGRIGTCYFFSKDKDSEIFRLTKSNLKKCFKDNPKFLELVEKNKGWDENEKIYDSFSNSYNENWKFKIVELYKESLK